MGASPNDEPFASPRNFFLCRERRVAVLFAEFLGRSLLPFSHFAAVDHDIMAIPLSLDLDLAKFDQSRFDLSMFRSPRAQGKRQAFQERAILDHFALRAPRTPLDRC